MRKLVLLHFGYDPQMRNVDQSPFHVNEAGSAATNTLVITHAPTVPLIENHASTRERWSLNSVTDSCRERILHKLPGCELMFKAEGHTVERKLQEHVDSLCLPFKFSVVTGPSGSYREHDILNYTGSALPRSGPPLCLSPGPPPFPGSSPLALYGSAFPCRPPHGPRFPGSRLTSFPAYAGRCPRMGPADFLEHWLEPWGPGRQWEFFLLDAYAPGLTDNVQRLCWSRGYICVTHGGGASWSAKQMIPIST